MIVPNLEELVSEAEQACTGSSYVAWLHALRTCLVTLPVDHMPWHVIWYCLDTTMPNNSASVHDDVWHDLQFELTLMPKAPGSGDYYSRETVLKAIDNLLYVVGTGAGSSRILRNS